MATCRGVAAALRSLAPALKEVRARQGERLSGIVRLSARPRFQVPLPILKSAEVRRSSQF